MSDIGRHIVKYRKAKGLSQEALGEQLHVTRQTISSWENERTLPDIQMLSVKVKYFVRDSNTAKGVAL